MPRPKLSKAVHDARGHLGKRGATKQRADLEITAAPKDPPALIKSDERAVEFWNALIEERLAKGLHTLFDVNAFALYCKGLSIVWSALERVEADGATSTGPKGGEVINKDLDVAIKDHGEFVQPFEDRNGHNPKARGQINVAPPTPDADAAKQAKYG